MEFVSSPVSTFEEWKSLHKYKYIDLDIIYPSAQAQEYSWQRYQQTPKDEKDINYIKSITHGNVDTSKPLVVNSKNNQLLAHVWAWVELSQTSEVEQFSKTIWTPHEYFPALCVHNTQHVDTKMIIKQHQLICQWIMLVCEVPLVAILVVQDTDNYQLLFVDKMDVLQQKLLSDLKDKNDNNNNNNIVIEEKKNTDYILNILGHEQVANYEQFKSKIKKYCKKHHQASMPIRIVTKDHHQYIQQLVDYYKITYKFEQTEVELNKETEQYMVVFTSKLSIPSTRSYGNIIKQVTELHI